MSTEGERELSERIRQMSPDRLLSRINLLEQTVREMQDKNKPQQPTDRIKCEVCKIKDADTLAQDPVSLPGAIMAVCFGCRIETLANVIQQESNRTTRGITGWTERMEELEKVVHNTARCGKCGVPLKDGISLCPKCFPTSPIPAWPAVERAKIMLARIWKAMRNEDSPPKESDVLQVIQDLNRSDNHG